MPRTIHWLEALNVGDRVICHPRAGSMHQSVHNLPRVAWVIRATKTKIVIGTTAGASTGSDYDRRSGQPWGRSSDYGTSWLTPYSPSEEQKLTERRLHLEAVSSLWDAAREVSQKLTSYDRVCRAGLSTAQLAGAEALLRQALAALTPPQPS